MHMCINTIAGKAMPADLQRNRIAVTRSVVSVLIQPVPAVPHEVRVEADDQISVRRLLLSDPVKHRVESTFTCTWNETVCFPVTLFLWNTSVCVDPAMRSSRTVQMLYCLSVHPVHLKTCLVRHVAGLHYRSRSVGVG